METAKQVIVEPVVNAVTPPSESIFSFFDTLLNNQTYLYLAIVIVVLGVAGWFLYTKYFNTLVNKEGEETKETKENKEDDKKENKKNFLNPTNDYYIVDPDGSPILITPYMGDIIRHSMQQKQQAQQAQQPPQMQQPQTQQPQMQQPQQPEQMQQKQKSRPKLNHPGEKAQIPDEINLSEPEDDNLGSQDLNEEEIKELKKQLDSMKKNSKYKVTAQNDEDSD